MPSDRTLSPENGSAHARREVLKWTGALAGASGFGLMAASASAATSMQPQSAVGSTPVGGELGRSLIGWMLAHEQFLVPELVEIGMTASRAGFHLLATSDHIQPWQANEGHAGLAWVTLGALGGRATQSWMGTTVTCPTIRYNPAVVAEAFASLSLLSPGRIFLGVGSGEALNEEATTGTWPKWQERWDRLIEAIEVIRRLWTGEQIAHQGRFFTVNAKLYDPPPQPIPLLTAANGHKSMRLAGIHGDGLITDPETWKKHKDTWQDGARSVGKNPAQMPVLVEQYAIVGDRQEAQRGAELWRFGPKAFKSYYNIESPVEIEKQANAQVPIDKVLESWVVSPDPSAHIAKLRELFNSGVSIVNVHCPQADQQRSIAFYAEHVLPAFRQPSAESAR